MRIFFQVFVFWKTFFPLNELLPVNYSMLRFILLKTFLAFTFMLPDIGVAQTDHSISFIAYWKKGDGKKFRLKAFNEGWAWAERKWTRVTSDTGIGNPVKATPEKGEKCFNVVVEKIGNLMFDLSNADINNMYE
jgi:hypothetical protein